MIAQLRGEVAARRADQVVILCGGVGYRAFVSAQTLRQVPAVGAQATLHTHLISRDDGLSLYGFASELERDLFLMLLSVQAVGPKVALALLSGGDPRQLVAALAAGDVARLQTAPGIGKRTAERIIVELREKVVPLAPGIPGAGAGTPAPAPSEVDELGLAREGLLGLGYTPQETERLLAGAEGESAEQLIAQALRLAGTS